MDTFPVMNGLEFEEAPHLYQLNGVPIPSVSAIIEPLSTVKYEGVRKDTISKAADKGTEVHNAIENYLKFGIEDISTARKPFFDAFLAWMNEHEVNVIASESRIYHRIMMYGGTVDLVARVDGVVTLIDYKTTYVISDMTCAPQLEAYAQALASHKFEVKRKMILHLRKDGTYEELWYPVKDPRSWMAFNALKTVYDYIQSCR